MRTLSALLLFAGLALLTMRETLAFGVAALVLAVFVGRSAWRRDDSALIAGLMLAGGLGGAYVIWSYLTALP